MCTSFAFYSDEPLYGMNFDFANFDLSFSVQELNDRKVFLCSFLQGKISRAVAGMNSFGLFANYQVMIPNKEDDYRTFYKPAAVLKHLLNPKAKLFQAVMPHMLEKYHSVDEITAYIKRYEFYFPPFKKMFKYHSLYADQKEALIFEIKDSGSEMIPSKGSFIVMSNFPHSDFKGLHYSEAYGFNCEAYKAASEYLVQSRACFTLDDALKALELSARKDGNYATRCSMVFRPTKQDVFLCFDADFSSIWKIDISQNTLESYRGVKSIKNIPFEQNGMQKSKILQLQS